LQSHLATTADVVGQNSTAALTFHDATAASEVLAALRAEAPIVSACLYNASGELFAYYQRAAEADPCPIDRTVHTPHPALPFVSRSILDHKEVVGTLCLTSDLEEVKRRNLRLLALASGLLCIALLIGGLAGSLLQRGILQPVLDLAGAMQDVTAQQNFTVRVPVSGSCEIAQLGRDFNTMISELQRHEQETRAARSRLQYQALNDELTGLPNRRLLEDRLSQALSIAQRDQSTIALLYLDLDGFKLVNDSLGHSIGDRLLKEVADRMRSRARKSDTIARMGGDEFTIVLSPVRSKHDCSSVAKDFLDLLSAPFLLDDHKISISASIGISTFPENAADAMELLQQADCAMYAAKRGGKNRFQFYNSEMGISVRERMNLETQLRSAVDRGEIAIHYQPEFDALTHRLVRFEALARWTHPTLGTISPMKFIPVAEESGIIVPLGTYILENAFAEACLWRQLSPDPVQVAVNVSSVQFASPNFLKIVQDILQRTQLPPALLQIELTESVMLRGAEGAKRTMESLHHLGVSLAIDDFGTGYSSLSYLPNLAFDTLKIDRAFILGLESRAQTQAVFQSLVKLARDMGLRVIAEGVEKSEQLAMDTHLGANEIQGFLLGRPTSDPATLIRKSLADSMTPEPDNAPSLLNEAATAD
jgi:diguanylate cyclase (GGDEF)-like protein